MLSGSLTQDSLVGVFRGISQKRRNGTLEISFQGRSLLLSFFQGKIVHVDDPHRPLSAEIGRRLQSAGKLSRERLEALVSSAVTVEALSQEMVSQNLVSSIEFIRAKNACELDFLYSLAELRTGTFHFQQEVVHVNPEDSLNLSSGQFLLDLVDFEMTQKRFVEIFGDLRSQSVCVSPLEFQIRGTHETENMAWHLLGTARTLKELYDQSLLSEYYLKNLLCSWYDKGFISMASLEDTKTTKEYSGVDLKGLEATLQSFEPEMPDHAPPPAGFSESEIVQGDTASTSLLEQESFNISPSAGELENGREAIKEPYWLEGTAIGAPLKRQGLRECLNRASFSLLEEEALQNVTFLVSLAYLVVFVLLAPRLLDNWFHAVSSFSSFLLFR